jgi:hypothetical protein
MVVTHKVQSGQVIRQHCPKIASGEAKPSPLREPEDVRPSMACIGGADCRKGNSGRIDVSNPAKRGNAAIPQDLWTSRTQEDRCAPL